MRIFSLDLRSLAVFRMSVGALLLADLFTRALSLRAHYTDWGALPRAFIIDEILDEWQWSLHLASGRTEIQALLFFMAAIFAACLLIGWRTRAATAASWILLVSLHNRSEIIIQAGDVLLRLLLFWGLFLPLGRRWSIDAALAGQDERAEDLSPATAAYVLQICMVYWTTAWLKNHPRWWSEGSAAYYALNLDAWSSSFGSLLLEHPAALKGLTFFTIYLEAFGPFLLFLPFAIPKARDMLRTLAGVLFFGLHMGLAASMTLGLFPWISIAGWIPLLPGAVWDLRPLRVPALLCSRTQLVKTCAKADSFLPTASFPQRLRAVGQGFVLANLVYVALWNIRFAGPEKMERIFPPSLNPYGRFLRLDQHWNMFAPYPAVGDGWFVIEGELADGSRTDLLRGGPVSWGKPARVADDYPDYRWRKYLTNLIDEEHANYRLHYGRYLCRRWNSSHYEDDGLRSLKLSFVRETTPPPGAPFPAPRSELLWSHHCSSRGLQRAAGTLGLKPRARWWEAV